MSTARLQVTDALGRRVVSIDRPLFTIGRRGSSDLQIISTDVSRDHAEIRRIGDNYVLRDCGSRYGLAVNGEAVTERTLVHGDRIRLGRNAAADLIFLTEDVEPSFGNVASSALDLRQVAAVLDSLRALGSGKVLDEVLTLVMDSALEVTNAERGFIMLAGPGGDLEFKVARGRGREPLPGVTFDTSQKIPREVFTTGQSRFFDDLLETSVADGHTGTVALGIRHVACVPLRVVHYAVSSLPAARETPIGVLYLDGRERGTLQSDAMRVALEAFAMEAALAIESARLYGEGVEKARLERELRIAAEIQQVLLPESRYVGRYCELAAIATPCWTIGGDFFDYVELPDGRFGFTLADVAGKGSPAALLAVAVQSVFAAQAALTSDPADTMTRINRILLRRAIEGRFATMFYGVLASDGCLSYCNAGQDPAIVVAPSGARLLETGGTVLGLFADAHYEIGTIDLMRRGRRGGLQRRSQ